MFHFIWLHKVYDYTHFILAGLYFLVFVIDSIVFLRAAYMKNLDELWKKSFHFFFLFGCSCNKQNS